jgi:hypothetical protein
MKPAQVRRVVWMLVVSGAAGLALSGCTEPGTLDIFSQVQTHEDRLPEAATRSLVGVIDADSTRLLWTDDEVVYLAALSDDSEQCLVVLEDVDAWSSCSSRLPIQLGSQGRPNMLFGDDLPDASEEWMKVADHLWTRP